MIEFINWVSVQTGGLRLFPREKGAAFRAAVLCIVGVTLWCVLLDVVLFKNSLPPVYRSFYTSPLWPRTLLASVQALSEELLYRLVLMTALVMLGVRLFGRLLTSWMVLSIVIAQFACVWLSVIEFPVFAALYFWLIGCVWGWLYWRHGWVTAAMAHCFIHLLLDPALYWLL